MTAPTGERNRVRDSRTNAPVYEIGGLSDHLGWIVLGVITSILLGTGSTPTLPRFSFTANWQITVGVTSAVVAALLWFIAEKGIRFMGSARSERRARCAARVGVPRTEPHQLGSRSLSTVTLWAFGLLFGAAVEELFWRGVMWQLLSESAGLSTVWVVVITSTGFAMTHLNSGIASTLSKLLGGLLLGMWIILFGSVLLAVIIHLSFNAMVLFQYSGGQRKMGQSK